MLITKTGAVVVLEEHPVVVFMATDVSVPVWVVVTFGAV